MDWRLLHDNGLIQSVSVPCISGMGRHWTPRFFFFTGWAFQGVVGLFFFGISASFSKKKAIIFASLGNGSFPNLCC
jgi:hypothetical protein